MGIKEYLLLVGAFLIVPLWYYLSRGMAALEEVLRDKQKRIALLLLSLILVDIVWFLIKTYLMVRQLPLPTKY